MKSLRQWVVEYPLSTGVMTELQWKEIFTKFKLDCLTFKASKQLGD